MSQENNSLKQLSKAQVKDLLWRKGSLSWLLDDNQKVLYDLFHKNSAKIQTWLCSRRTGKTYCLLVLAVEYCIKHPNSVIKYVGPTKDQIKKIIRKELEVAILQNGYCPDDLKPQFNKQDGIYYFSNGSEIQLCAGEGGNIESIRGGYANIAIIDEAQDISELKYAVNSVLLPTTATTKGKVLVSGTPSKDPDHEFNYFIEKAEMDGVLTKRTIRDNPRLSKKDQDELIEAMGGETSEDCRRELFCERIRSKKTTVIPEFDEKREIEMIKVWDRPAFYHPYSSMDLGFRDMTIVLFAYHDFINDKIVIEDELVRQGESMHLSQLAKDIENKENELWIDPLTNEKFKVRKRVADHDLIAIQEIRMASNYRINFEPADKRDMMGGINFLRTLVNNNKIVINPKCKVTINHLKNAKWANTAKDNLGRGADDSHYDAIPALSYLMRGIDFGSNPFPANYKSTIRREDAFYPNKTKEFPNQDVYMRMLGLNKKQPYKPPENK